MHTPDIHPNIHPDIIAACDAYELNSYEIRIACETAIACGGEVMRGASRIKHELRDHFRMTDELSTRKKTVKQVKAEIRAEIVLPLVEAIRAHTLTRNTEQMSVIADEIITQRAAREVVAEKEAAE